MKPFIFHLICLIDFHYTILCKNCLNTKYVNMSLMCNKVDFYISYPNRKSSEIKKKKRKIKYVCTLMQLFIYICCFIQLALASPDCKILFFFCIFIRNIVTRVLHSIFISLIFFFNCSLFFCYFQLLLLLYFQK